MKKELKYGPVEVMELYIYKAIFKEKNRPSKIYMGLHKI